MSPAPVLGRPPVPAPPTTGGNAAPWTAGALTVGAPGDAFELEADRIADRVMSPAATPPLGEVSPVAAPRLQRMCDACRQDTEEHAGILQRKPAGPPPASTAAPPMVHAALAQGGSPLGVETRRFMESRFGRGFGSVRIHADALAAESAQSVGARAYTVGRHVFFGGGEYRPESTEGRRLIAHELAHVVQQESAGPRLQRAPASTRPSPSPETRPGFSLNGKAVTDVDYARSLWSASHNFRWAFWRIEQGQLGDAQQEVDIARQRGVISAISETLGGADLPDMSIWEWATPGIVAGRRLLNQAEASLRAWKLLEAQTILARVPDQLRIAEASWKQAEKHFADYVNKTITGAKWGEGIAIGVTAVGAVAAAIVLVSITPVVIAAVKTAAVPLVLAGTLAGAPLVSQAPALVSEVETVAPAAQAELPVVVPQLANVVSAAAPQVSSIVSAAGPQASNILPQLPSALPTLATVGTVAVAASSATMASDSPVGDLPPVGPSPPKTDDKPKKRKCGDPELPFTHVDYQAGPRGQGYKVTARPLTQCAGNTQGSPPSPSMYAHQFACIAGAGQTGSWVRAHLLHGKTSGSVGDLHGPGNRTWNLIIADKSLNGGMSKRAELPAIAAVYAANRVLWYESTVDGYVPGRDFFAEAVTVRWGLYDPVTKTPGPAIVSERFPRKKDPPNCP